MLSEPLAIAQGAVNVKPSSLHLELGSELTFLVVLPGSAIGLLDQTAHMASECPCGREAKNQSASHSFKRCQDAPTEPAENQGCEEQIDRSCACTERVKAGEEFPPGRIVPWRSHRRATSQ